MAKRRRSSKNNQNMKYLAIVVGIFILFSMYNISREDSIRVQDVQNITYDGTESHFDITLEDWEGIATIDEEMIVSLRVANLDTVTSMMYVQCSFLSEDEDFDDVCGSSDSDTQIYQIDLYPYGDQGENRLQNYYLMLPHSPASYRIYCRAFEQCNGEDINPMVSDSSYQTISVNPPDSNSQPYDSGDNDDSDESTTCIVDSDCGSWFNNQECINGVCRDVEVNLRTTDSEITAWARDHEIMIWGIGLVLLLIGSYAVYKEPDY